MVVWYIFLCSIIFTPEPLGKWSILTIWLFRSGLKPPTRWNDSTLRSAPNTRWPKTHSKTICRRLPLEQKLSNLPSQKNQVQAAVVTCEGPMVFSTETCELWFVPKSFGESQKQPWIRIQGQPSSHAHMLQLKTDNVLGLTVCKDLKIRSSTARRRRC